MATGLTRVVNADLFAALATGRSCGCPCSSPSTGLVTVGLGMQEQARLMAFLGSCAFLAGMLTATAACLFPVMFRAIDDNARSLTAYNSSSPHTSLQIAFSWWILGFPLAVLYFVVLFRIHRGKAIAATGREGY